MSQDPVVKALNAQRLRKSEEFVEAVNKAHDAILLQWEHGATVADRERAHAKLLVLKEILMGLQEIENEGAVEYKKRGGNPASEDWDTSTGQPTG